jgi:hypothetical protein
MTTIAQDLQNLILSVQGEINATHDEFKVMLEMRKAVMAEYEMMAKEYVAMKEEIKEERLLMEQMRESINNERKEILKERKKLQINKTNKQIWTGLYPVKTIPSSTKVKS